MNNKFNGKPFFIVVIERAALVVAYFFNMVMVGPNHSITVYFYFYFERCVNNHNLLLLLLLLLMMINKLALNQIEHSKAKSMDNNLSIVAVGLFNENKPTLFSRNFIARWSVVESYARCTVC